ncbi:MAG TPA: arginine deiminase family protein [Blastocatellia bacterium]|nr:arginine deiminase family protein [Blastocatellia bacterium]
MLIGLTRLVSASINDCELTFHEQQPIDVERAIEQHRAYEDCLRNLGVEIVRLPAEPDLPDAVFVEDTAIVVDEVAVIPVMGAASRRPETASVAAALKSYRPLRYLEAPATLDGGDVLRVGRRVFVGLTHRTNREGIAQLSAHLAPFGYKVRAVEVTGCLHLKSACTQVGDGTLLINRDWVDATAFAEFELIDVAATEPGAANALLIGEAVVMPSAFPQTIELLEARGIKVRSVDVSEFQKAEGGITCKSIIFNSSVAYKGSCTVSSGSRAASFVSSSDSLAISQVY